MPSITNSVRMKRSAVRIAVAGALVTAPLAVVAAPALAATGDNPAGITAIDWAGLPGGWGHEVNGWDHDHGHDRGPGPGPFRPHTGSW
ncbi:hypothetical protein K7711_16105 [Nocardia sp. CA2R105]|uniref:hypothetical protein n=1 Tax=Nocardia coffeae TaxID=2873381 RepID=UPI001CA635C7|nr:hypothetical protein [Nocardia coffeae]MBY8858010.1 hypothetical protein [Nocardia coffeae]